MTDHGGGAFAPSRPVSHVLCMGHLEDVLVYLGEDPARNGLKDTPKRVVKSWEELFSGYDMKPEEVFTVFEEAHDEMVILKRIRFFSFCEHHMLPFFGTVDIGYTPTGKIVGISKLARLVDVYARRLQVQERLGSQIVDAIMQHLQPTGAGVVIRAQHLCMMARGVKQPEPEMVTSALRGSFREQPKTRAEFLGLIR